MKREKAAIKKFKIAIDAKDLTDFQKIVICFEKNKLYEDILERALDAEITTPDFCAAVTP